MVTHITLTNTNLANNCLRANWQRDKLDPTEKETGETEKIF